jgi:hypothetical protein
VHVTLPALPPAPASPEWRHAKRSVLKGLLLVSGSIEHIVAHETKHFVDVHIRVSQMPRQCCRERAVCTVAVGRNRSFLCRINDQSAAIAFYPHEASTVGLLADADLQVRLPLTAWTRSSRSDPVRHTRGYLTGMVVTEITNDIAGARLVSPSRSSRPLPAHSAVDGAAMGFDSADRRRQRFSARYSKNVVV